MAHRIGFTNKFFTLWDVQVEPVYFTDTHGTHHLVREKANFNYIKNISFDQEEAKRQYPGVAIDEGLRGKVRNFTIENSEEDACPEILKFGKYLGHNIAQIAETDFNYILWILENGYNGKTKDACGVLPKVVEHFAAIEKANNERMAGYPVAESGLVELTFLSNPNTTVSESLVGFEKAGKDQLYFSGHEHKHYANATIGDNNHIKVIFENTKYVDGMYPYRMGVIDGKAKRIKNKTIKVNIEILFTEKNTHCAYQVAIIKP